MSSAVGFQPNWASPPGETITKILGRKDLTIATFAKKIGYSIATVNELLEGKLKINSEIAEKLEVTLGPSSEFWIARENQYRSDIDWLDKEGNQEEGIEWLKDIPFKDMINFGWIKSSSNKKEIAAKCLNFFNVPDVRAWYETYDASLKLVAFRTSYTFESQIASVAAWLRQGEIEGQRIKCKNWNPEKFRENLAIIRVLTRKKNPAIFIPELQKLCAEAGVAVVIVRAPKGCRASGATRFLSKDKGLIQLSFRYRSDDHFWFTFFHEAGHLLLHSQSDIFLESAVTASNKEEDEANNFATDILVPNEHIAELYTLSANSYKKVMRFAKRIGISHGIVVGQLQHRNIIQANQLNYLKTRFKWI
ncbi:MAG: ImmA/IrrE family metallo-endopeptidase [Alphaproteobacteria bacterium]|nr:ImmA/IrrE family metallo-endopeptidase [Alphaproteobacteria bacterium]